MILLYENIILCKYQINSSGMRATGATVREGGTGGS